MNAAMFALGVSIARGERFTESIIVKYGTTVRFHVAFANLQHIIDGALYYQSYPITFKSVRTKKYFIMKRGERLEIRSIVIEFEVPVEEEWLLISSPTQKAYVHFIFHDGVFIGIKNFCPDGPQEDCILCKDFFASYRKYWV